MFKRTDGPTGFHRELARFLYWKGGFTSQSLADKCGGIDYKTVERWLSTGSRQQCPGPDNMRRLAAALGCTINELRGEVKHSSELDGLLEAFLSQNKTQEEKNAEDEKLLLSLKITETSSRFCVTVEGDKNSYSKELPISLVEVFVKYLEQIGIPAKTEQILHVKTEFGSIFLTFEMPEDWAKEIERAVKNGHLQEAGIIDARITTEATEVTEATEERGHAALVMTALKQVGDQEEAREWKSHVGESKSMNAEDAFLIPNEEYMSIATIKKFSMDQNRFVIGRDPDCEIVIPATPASVSRKHAVIVRIGETYVIEDLGSRNGTFVNGTRISGRMSLKHNDIIRISDFQSKFILPQHGAPNDKIDELTKEVTGNRSESSQKEDQASVKLRLFVELSKQFSEPLEFDSLSNMASILLRMFPGTDRCFVILVGDGGKLTSLVVKTRLGNDEAFVKFSVESTRRCLDFDQPFLSDNTNEYGYTPSSQYSISSVMCVPLLDTRRVAFGVLQLETNNQYLKFTNEDIELLTVIANQLAATMEHSRSKNIAILDSAMIREMELARRVQASFLPYQPPTISGYDFYASYLPAGYVSGDFYDFISLPDERLAVVLGDVFGRGVPAALAMAKITSDVRFSLMTESNLAKAIAMLNNLVATYASRNQHFVTLCVVIINPVKNELTLVSAGHASPLLFRPDAELVEVVSRDTVGFILGVQEDMDFDTYRMSIQPGESLILFSDGIFGTGKASDGQLGLHSIQAAVQGAGGISACGLGERIINHAQLYASNLTQCDDVTLIVIQRNRADNESEG